MSYTSKYTEAFFSKQFHRGKPVPMMFLRHVLAIPFIWSFSILIPIMDLWTEVYHRVAFPLFGIPPVKRSKYIRIDHHDLSKLTVKEKLFCMYCGYINGWLEYAVAIAGETENYWCAIVHKKSHDFVEPPHHKNNHFEDRAKFS